MISSDIPRRQIAAITCECKVCGGTARYSYYGAIVCHSCRIFFRRTATYNKTKKTCENENKCEINLNNRHICSPCRLTKCFAIGMNREMIRSSLSQNRKGKSINHINITSPISSSKKQPYEQIPTLNLLQSDQSILSIEQWNLLSNLIHSFDQYSGYSYVLNFIQEQNTLPLKLRYRYSAVSEFFTSMMNQIQCVFEKNRDFLSLSTNDRTILLRITAEYTSSIGGIFLLYQSHLFDYSLFYQSTQTIFSSNSTATIKRVIDHLDSDDTFIKLVLALLAFSTTNYTIYSGSMSHLIDSNAILPTQNLYTEITWRYLLHKYNQNEAVVRFMNVIRCMLLVNRVIVEAHDSQQFMEIVDGIIEQSERKLYV
ncbi:hypothetical protein I4U23_026883 [Adineta vaga]|nr:hypothetical protein I4U23_026883 [Adineta vaga]